MTLANWPVIVIRIIESLLLLALLVASVIAVLVPIFVSAGIGWNQGSDPTNVVSAILEHWIVIVYALGILTVMLIVCVAIHSFVDGGTTQVLVDSERSETKPVFTLQRWMAGGRSTWWPIFWIYNIVWSVAGIVILVPLAATLAGMFVVSDNTGRVAIACGGLLLSFIVMVPTAIVAGVWAQKAIAVCVGRNTGANDAMRVARKEMMADFGRHFVVALIVFVVSVGGAGVLSTLSMPFSMSPQNHPFDWTVIAPLQIILSIAQSAFSAGVGTWFLASFVSMTEEP